MDIRIVDHFVFADYGNTQVNNSIVNQIASHTTETWQPDRANAERGRNTRQGKIAEDIVESFIGEYFKSCISIKSYDEIRNDDFEKHAPFDFLLWETGKADISPIEASIRNDIASAQNRFVRLSENTRRLCRRSNVKIAEVKSTKIRDKLKQQASFENDYYDDRSVIRLVDTIKRTDDVFCYPHYKRSESNQNYSPEDYCSYVKSVEPSLENYNGEDLKRKVIDLEAEKQCCDIFIRVYVDTQADKGIVIGWIQKDRLLDNNVVFKRMNQPGKSATTAQAVMQTQIDKNIRLNYIMVQIPEKCSEKSDAFKAGYSNICEIGEERIRRAAGKLRKKYDCEGKDFGFRVFRTDDSNMKDVYYSPADTSQAMLYMLESNIKEDRTGLDLLFGCLLEWGLPLSLPYTSEEIDGFTVHIYNGGDLVACFDEDISDAVIKTIAKRRPVRAVFRDSCFSGSPAKINVAEIFKMLAPDSRVKVI